MRLQWALPVRSGHSQGRIDGTFYTAAAALSLTGGAVRRNAEKGTFAAEVATQWLRTGAGHLASYDDSEHETQRKAAEAIVKATRTRAEVMQIHETDQQFFKEIDLERPEMHEVARHVASGDMARAEPAYVEVLSARFSRMQGWPDIDLYKEVDLPDADDNCQNIFVLRAHMFRRYDFGETVDWAKVIDGDIESRVWMNAHPWMSTLLSGYRETADEKYVRHLCRLFNSWYESSPPSFERTWAQWRTLEAGGRAALRWGAVLVALSEHPTFQRQCLFNMARSMLDHGKYLTMYAADGRNWLQVESSGLACVALLFPEFKLSPVFYEVAMKRLAWVNASAFLSDGFQSEGSLYYHRFPLATMASALRLARFSGSPIPKSLLNQYEAGVEAMQ